MSFKVSNRLISTLEVLQDHSAPVHVILVKNSQNKHEWKIIPDDYTPNERHEVVQKE